MSRKYRVIKRRGNKRLSKRRYRKRKQKGGAKKRLIGQDFIDGLGLIF